jgi:hypothetical protein
MPLTQNSGTVHLSSNDVMSISSLNGVSISERSLRGWGGGGARHFFQKLFRISWYCLSFLLMAETRKNTLASASF